MIAVSIGDKKCQDTLRTALAMGGDRAIHIDTDVEVQPLGVAKLLSKVVESEQIGLVILGKQAIDGDHGQTGPMLAGLLQWPQASCASRVEVTNNNNKASVVREVEGGLETLEVPLPAVITADLRLNEPRYVTLPNIMKAKKKQLDVKTPQQLQVDVTPTQKTTQVVEPPVRKGGGTVPDVDGLVAKLKSHGFVKN